MANNIQSYVMILKDWTPCEIESLIKNSDKITMNIILLEAAKIVSRVNNAHEITRTLKQDSE